MPSRVLTPSFYFPTAPRGGGAGEYLYRVKNFILRGVAGGYYLEGYSGSLDLSETIAGSALTGTITLTNGSQTVTGLGTAFTTELWRGQFIVAHDAAQAKSYLLVVERIASNTSLMVTKAPVVAAGGSGITATRAPVLFDLNGRRGSLLHGNALEFDKGNILSVGMGTLRVDGAALSASLVHTNRKPVLALYNAGTYTILPLAGMPAPSAPTLTAVAGTGKGMRAGTYGVVFVPARQATRGYNNGSVVATVELADDERIEFTNPTFDGASGNDAWRPYVTLFSGTAAAASLGPFYYYGSNLTGTGTKHLEWIDAEVKANEILTFNNDPPPDSAFVASVAGYPIYISAFGPGNTAPGPVIVPAKPNNPEAAPASLAAPTSPPEEIIGVREALGRLFLLTGASLQVGQSTGRTETLTPQDLPMLVRSFWRATGFRNPYQLNFINDTLYGFPDAGPTRSNADGVEASVQREFAAPVRELCAAWNRGQVLCEHDPVNDAWAIFHAADSLNASGYWTTRVLLFGIPQQGWIGDIVLESTTRDMIVTGVAAVGGKLEFIAGGRTSGGAVEFKTYRFDAGSGVAVSGYAAWGFSDSGAEERPKCVDAVRVTGRLAGASCGIHGAEPGETINVTTLEAGNSGSKSGAIALADASAVAEGAEVSVSVPNLKQWTLRVDFVWDGTGARPRIDEAVCAWRVEGARI